jgi:hypothetical protein
MPHGLTPSRHDKPQLSLWESITAPFKWNAWQDVGIEYVQSHYMWVVVQTRTRKSDNKREIRHVVIMQHGGALSEKTISKLTSIMHGDEEKPNE